MADLNNIIENIKKKIPAHYKPEALVIGSELRNLVKEFESGLGRESLNKLRDLLNRQEGITLHEIASSNLITVL